MELESKETYSYNAPINSITGKVSSSSTRILRKRSSRTSTQPTMYYFKDFCSAKEGWIRTNYNKPETSQCLYKDTKIQTNKPCKSSSPTKERRLVSQAGYQGRIPTYPYKKGLQEIPSLFLQKAALFLQDNAIWANIRPILIHQSNEVSNFTTNCYGNPGTSVSGRPSNLGRVRREMQEVSRHHSTVPGVSGFLNKLEEVRVNPFARNRMARGEMGHSPRSNRHNRQVHKGSVPASLHTIQSRSAIAARPSNFSRKMRIRFSDLSKEQTAPAPARPVFTAVEQRRGKPSTKTARASKDSGVVGSSREFQRGRAIPESSCRSTIMDRRVRAGVRSSHLQRRHHPRNVVPGLAQPAYQCQGIADYPDSSRKQYYSILLKCSSVHRQLDGNVLCKESGLQQVAYIAGNSGADFQGSRRQESSNSCQLPTRNHEHRGRQSVKTSVIRNGTQDCSPRLPSDCSVERIVPGGRHGCAMEQDAKDIHFSSSTRGDTLLGFFQHRPKQMESDLFISSSEQSFEGFVPSEQLPGARSDSGSVVADVPLVQSATEDVFVADTIEKHTSLRSASRQATKQDILALSRFQFLKRFLSQKYTEEVAQDLIGAYRKSSQRQHEVAWRRLQSWLVNTDGMVDKSLMLRFFRDIFHTDRLQPSTVLAYRASLAYPMQVGFSFSLRDEEFSLLAKSQFLNRPPTQHIFPAWDLNKVLNLLQSDQYAYGSADRNRVLNKGLFILALASGGRVSELSAFFKPGVCFSRDSSRVTIPVRPGFLFKNQRLKRAPPNLELTALVDEEGLSHALCPLRALTHVINLPTTQESTAVFAFLSGRPLSRASIASRLARVIKEANPDKIAKAHDLRKVAGSIAWTRGVSPQEIVNRGFWTSYNTFLERYLGPINLPGVPCCAMGSS